MNLICSSITIEVDSLDQSHIVVSQKGDGSSLSGSRFSYELLSKGSSLSIGSSAVLGSNAHNT